MLRDRQQRPLGCLLFSQASRALACRDAVVGWRAGECKQHLDLLRYHRHTVSELLAFLHFDGQPEVWRTLSCARIKAFVQSVAKRCSRGSLQHTVAHLRAFLGFLANRGETPTGRARAAPSNRPGRCPGKPCRRS